MSMDADAGRSAETGTDAGADPLETTVCAYTDYREGESHDEYPKTGEGATGVEREIWDALYEVQDPEMPVSVVDLGLIYDVEVTDGRATIEMTLTYTGCPARSMITNDVRCAAMTASGIEDADVRLRYSPEWNVNMVTERGREQLREFGLSL
jgi:metal-sulfur cluster biosynthetic enzyme